MRADCGCLAWTVWKPNTRDGDAIEMELCSLHEAAPKLLEAAKFSLSVLLEGHADESLPVHNAIRKLDAAIRKAEDGE